MKPKDVVLNTINKYLMDVFAEHGFEFSESQIAFKRKLPNGFVQLVKFHGNLRNTENLIVRYGDQYLIYCSSYKRWWTTNFPEIPLIGAGYLSPNPEKLVMLRRVIKEGTQYDFLRSSELEISEEIKLNFLDYGLQFFEDNDSWEKLSAKAGSLETEIDAQILSKQYERADANIRKGMAALAEAYGDESTMRGNAKQIYDILLSRQKYVKKWL